LTHSQTQVLIIGAGPVGLITTIMLNRLGIDTVLVEKRSGLHDAPQAHVISSRSMEICRSIGIEDASIRSIGSKPLDTAFIRWVDHLLENDLGVFSMMSEPAALERMLTQSPSPVCNLSQDQFEAVLFDHLPDDRRPLFEHEWLALREIEDGYISQVERNDGSVFEISSKFIIAADGAGSRARSAIGARMEGPDHIQSYVTVHFNANLRNHLKDRVGLLYWVMDPECEGCFIAHDIDHNWIYMNALREELPSNEIDESVFEARLRKAIGADIEIDIRSYSTWRMTAQVSSAYQKDGVFLVGDAAHRFPPTGGLGMNTGIQDAHNLTWKLAMVLKGADAELLDTYEIERRPPALNNSRQSHENFSKMSEVESSLDVDGDGILSQSDFDTVLNNPVHRASVQTAIERQAKHFNMTGLDLGVCYTSSAIVLDGAPPNVEDPILQYIPSTVPGTRLPHAWLERGEERISTLDMVRADRFVVLAFQTLDEEVLTALEADKSRYQTPELIVIAENGDAIPADEQCVALFPKDQILIVRPDGHIAARIPVDEAGPAVRQAFETILPKTGAIPSSQESEKTLG
jgi:2,4-dichlorophenol 6-monooxygenase